MEWLGYTRVSRVGDRAERLISPDQQAERIKGYAKSRGLNVRVLEPELDVSGGKVDRPILTAAIEEIEAGKAAGIIVAQLDRLSRAGITETLRVIERIEEAGGKVVAVAENFDDSTPEGRMQREIMLSLANMQLGRYSAQFRDSKRRAVEAGIWPMPIIPRGYRLGKDRHLEVDRRSARKVIAAFEARAAGTSWQKVADILDAGYNGARKTIQNRVYLGEINLRINGEVAVNPDAHDAIVSRDLFEAAQIEHPRPNRGTHGPALLTGLPRCASCGHTMTVDQAHGQRLYRCRGRFSGHVCEAPAIISQRIIEPYVERVVLSRLRAEVRIGPRTDQAAEAEAALGEAEAELVSFQTATSAAGVGAEHFATGLRERVEAVEAAREELGRSRAGTAPTASADALDAWEELSVEDRRAVLSRVLGVVWVRKGRAAVEERVRLIALGDEPADLSGPGRRASCSGPDGWDNLDGEIRPTAA